MPNDKFYIGPLKSGQQTDVRPYAIADDAYEILHNAYVWQGRLRKRFGSLFTNQMPIVIPGRQQLRSRLRVKLGTVPGVVPGVGNYVGTTPQNAALALIVPPAIGQMFSVGETVFTVNALGAPANLLRSDGGAVSTFHTGTGVVTLNAVPVGADVYYYPAAPVMGICTLEADAVNNENTVAFDPYFAYNIVNDGWERMAAGGDPAYWTGTNSDFFWAYNCRGNDAYQNYLFVTNGIGVAGHYMRYWDGAAWNDYRPEYSEDGGNFYINTCRVIIPFKNRLLLMNTREGAGDNAFVNRIRYSWLGSFIDPAPPLEQKAFREDVPGRGGFLDIPYKENIVTALFLRDRLIIYCERSTWELVPTGIDTDPFTLQQINATLGAESTFSQISFDQIAVGIGNIGIHACDGNSVKRIDENIPFDVYKIHNLNDAPKRVCGIRDYYNEMAYWTFPTPTSTATNPYPDRVMVYNYKTGSWAYNDDSFTFFGYTQNRQGSDILWGSDNQLWGDDDSTWESTVLNAQTRNVCAGNQQGFITLIIADKTTNETAMQVTDVTDNGVDTITLTIINHNLKVGEYIYLNYCLFNAALPYDFNDLIYKVDTTPTDDTVTLEIEPYQQLLVGGNAYIGGGLVSRVSRIEILTKQYNFYANKGNNLVINKIDFLVDLNPFIGNISLDYLTSTSLHAMQTTVLPWPPWPPALSDAEATGALLGTATLEFTPYADVPFEALQRSSWHSMYPQAEGQFIQLRLFFDDYQMLDNIFDATHTRRIFNAFQDFQLSAMIYNTMPVTRF